MKNLTGIVVSLAMKDTAVVLVAYTIVHPKYKKIMKRSTKIKAHNTLTDLHLGDVVSIISSRPISRDKHFTVKEVLSKSTVPVGLEPVPPMTTVEDKPPVKRRVTKKKI